MAETVHILYHYPCADGVFSALAAWLRFAHAAAGDITLRFVPCRTYDGVDARVAMANALPQADRAYLLDYSGGPAFIAAVCARATKVWLLDHHKTAKEDLDAMAAAGTRPANLNVDDVRMEASGCAIALAHFDAELGAHGGLVRTAASLLAPLLPAKRKAGGDAGGGAGGGAGGAGGGGAGAADTLAAEAARIGLLFAYVEDNDLWTHALPDSKAFSAGLATAKLEYDASESQLCFGALLKLDPAALIEAGKARLAEQQRAIDAAVGAAFPVRVGAHGAFLAALTHRGGLRSGMGHALAHASKARGLRAMGGVVYLQPGAMVAGEGADAALRFKVSLRSLAKEEDTTAISKSLGGGGHACASSCFATAARLRSWREAAAAPVPATEGGAAVPAAAAAAPPPAPPPALDAVPSEEYLNFVPTLNAMGFMTSALDPFSRAFVDAVPGAPNKCVLDIGAAYGVAALPALAAGSAAGVRVLACDVGVAHLARLWHRAPPAHRGRLSLVPAEFGDASGAGNEALGKAVDGATEGKGVGAVLVCRVFHFFDGARLRNAIAQLHAWLAPGGRAFVVAETPYLKNMVDSFLPVYEARLAENAAAAGTHEWPGWVDDFGASDAARSGKKLPKSMHLLDPTVLAREFERAGFEVERAEFIDRRCAPSPLPPFLQLDGRESVGVVARKPA